MRGLAVASVVAHTFGNNPAVPGNYAIHHGVCSGVGVLGQLCL